MLNKFREAIAGAGLNPPDVIEPGRMHRFPGAGKRTGNTAGWCKLFEDGMGGSFGDWSQDFTADWQAERSVPFTPMQREAFFRQVKESKAQAKAEKMAKQSDAAAKAAAIWRLAQPAANDHPYLSRKAIGPNGAKVHDGALVIPMREGAALHSLQFIGADGVKRFLTDGKKKGCYCSIGNPAGAAALCIAEGFATGATIHEATGLPVAVAFDAGNLESVALTVRTRYPNLSLIICADDDMATEGNPGVTKATAAAFSVGGRLAIPAFGENRPPAGTDFNDMAAHCGNEAVRLAIEGATIPIPAPDETSAANGAMRHISAPDSVVLIRGDSIKPEAVRWLWDGWLARGKFHVLAGAPGTGKTTIALALTATLSMSGRWPDGSHALAGNVIIWSGEDDPSDTLAPRLLAMGADMTRVHFVTNTIEQGEPRPFDPSRDMTTLTLQAAEIGDVRLLIVDPVVSAVAGDSHKNADTRRALQPLVDLGAKLDCAVVGISHYSKGTQGRDPLERVTGSLAFGALARVVWGTAKGAEEGQLRRLVRAKSNIGPDGGGFEYDLEQTEVNAHPGLFASRVLWQGAIEGGARELLAEAETIEGEPNQLSDTTQWLNDLLSEEGGKLDKKTIVRLAKENGHAERTVQRAREKLGVTISQTGFGREKKSVWALPISGDGLIRANHANECQPEKHGTHGMNGQNGEAGEVF